MHKTWRFAAAALFLLAIVAGAFVGDQLLALSGSHPRSPAALHRAARDLQGSLRRRGQLRGPGLRLDPRHAARPRSAHQLPRAGGLHRRCGSASRAASTASASWSACATASSPSSRRSRAARPSRLGIRAGDVISLIEGEPTETMTLDEAVQQAQGPQGHPGHDHHRAPRPRRAARARPSPAPRSRRPRSRYAYMLDAETGYIPISDFARSHRPRGGRGDRARSRRRA